MDIKRVDVFVILLGIGVVLLLNGLYSPIIKEYYGTQIFIGVICIIIGFTAIRFDWGENELGKLLTFDDLRKGRVKVLESYKFPIIKIASIKEAEDCRYLEFSYPLPKNTFKAGTIIEITGFKKKHFKDLDKNMFFLDGNTILHIVTSEELAHEESALARSSTRGHSWNA